MDRPRVRSYLMVVAPERFWIMGERGSELLLADPDGWVQALIELLDGKNSRGSIHRTLLGRWPGLTEADVAGTIAVLDAAGFVDDADTWVYFRPPRRRRYELASWRELAHVAMSG